MRKKQTHRHTHILVWGFMSNKLKKKQKKQHKDLVQKFLPTFHLRIAMHLRNTDSITSTVLPKTGWGWEGEGRKGIW